MQELKKRRVEKQPPPSEKYQHHHPIPATAAAAIKEPELSEEEKAKQRSKPISSTPVPGTPWCVVWTRDKRVFFFNPSEKVSLWERPAVLIGRNDVDKMVRECPATADSAAAATTNGSAKKKIAETAAEQQQPPVKKVKFDELLTSLSKKIFN